MSKFSINNTLPEVKVGNQNMKDMKPKSREYTAIPEGIYNCKVHEVEFGVSNTGEETISVILKVVDGDYRNKNVYQNFWFNHSNEKLVWVHKKIFNELLTAIGFSEEESTKIKEDFEKYNLTLVGKYVRVKIKHNESGGKTYANIDKLQKSLGDYDNGSNLLSAFEEKENKIKSLLGGK